MSGIFREAAVGEPCRKVNSRSTLRKPARATGRGKVAQSETGDTREEGERGRRSGREWAAVGSSGSANTKEKGRKRGRVGGWEGVHCAQRHDTALRS